MTVLSAFLLAVQIALFVSVSSMEIYTSKELQAKNGTDTRLKCTFSSSSPLGEDITVSWTFRPLSGGIEESVFYYFKKPFPPSQGHFRGRAIWDGDVGRSDGSIIIRNIQQIDNGTYLCQVKNPPDVHGEMGEIILKVVDKGIYIVLINNAAVLFLQPKMFLHVFTVKFSEIMLLALVIGVGSVFIIVLVLIVVWFRSYRKQKIQSTAVSVMECTEKLNEKPCDLTDANA